MSDFSVSVSIVATMAIVTALTRFIPFILFDRGKQAPSWIKYLGYVLPSAIMSVLLIYCLKDVNFTGGNFGIPELVCIAVAIGLHIWKGNVLLSIGASTVLYMIFVQVVFI